MRDLLSDALIAESGVTKLHLDDGRDDFLRWTLRTGLASNACGREEAASQAESIRRLLQPAARPRLPQWPDPLPAIRRDLIATRESSALRLSIRLFRSLSHSDCRVIENSPWSGFE
jgi:hypothetical protein